MKKFVLSFSVIALYVLYIIYDRQHMPVVAPLTLIGQNTVVSASAAAGSAGDAPPIQNNSTPAIAVQTAPVQKPAAKSQPAPAPTPKPTPVPAPAPKNIGMYKDGQYTGSAVDVFYGNVQVAAVISGGKLTDVQILQYPSDRGYSRQVAQQSLPILRSEAIASQSANVDAVSGATQTSSGFIQSLSSALAMAK